MKKRWVLLLLVHTLLLYQCSTRAETLPVYREGADVPVERRTIVPEGVTEINLRAFLGDDVQDVSDAWMLRENVYVILLWSEEEDQTCEIILLDTQNGTLLSRTPVPYLDYAFVSTRPGWVDGVLHLMFWAWDEAVGEEYPGRTYIKVSISPDDAVDVSDYMQSWYTVMPGGKITIRKADDGSLYAVDVATAKEKLLIQGVSKQEFFNQSSDKRGKYVPFKDELPGSEGDTDSFRFGVYDPEDHLRAIRDFGYVTPLDDHRFAYGINAWEWESGFGIYDLQTHTDHRITSNGCFLGEAGGYIIGSTLKVDANTYETSMLPESLRPALEFTYALENDYLDHSISPDCRLLALTSRDSYGEVDLEHTVTIADMDTGEIVKTYDIDNPFAEESSVAFYDDTHVMLFCGAKENGSAYIYLINVEE